MIQIKFCWNFNGEDYESIIQQARQAELHPFDAVLIVSLQQAMDPWILATQLSNVTSRLRLLVAQNTNTILPTYTAKAIHTLNLIANDRVDLNVVTGSSNLGISNHMQFLDHQARYKRTEEFVQIIRKSRQGTINHQGEYYNVNEFQVRPRADLNASTGIFIAGSSEEAIAIAARYGDCYVAYASDMETTKQLFSRCRQLAAECEREVMCGLLIDVIARETSEEAWEAAGHMLSNFSRTDKMMKTILMKKIDSVGIAEHRRLMSYDQFRVDATLWSGISQISMAHALSIVGSYSEVVETIQRFQEIGANYFIFSGMANDREIERLGQFVIPYLN